MSTFSRNLMPLDPRPGDQEARIVAWDGRDGDVLRLHAMDGAGVATLLARYGLDLAMVNVGEPIPGSYWGDEEAGLVATRLYARADTPVHSVLHETCHVVCMDADRRAALDTNAAGDYDEENAVCYLQIVLSGWLPGYSRARQFADMDAWGYTFRLGSARAWFERDALDARDWLIRYGLLSVDGEQPTWRLRGD